MKKQKCDISKKICHVTSAHKRYDVRIFHKECKSLAKYGFDVTLLVNDNIEDELIDGVNIKSTRFNSKNRYERMVVSQKLIKKKAIEIDADIYHFHDPELLPLGIKLLKKGKKIIYDSHEDVPRQILAKDWIPLFLRKPISFIFERYENMLTKKITAIVVTTPHIFNRFNKINKNTCQICNFPLLNEFIKYPDRDFSSNSGCYVGGISNNRGIRQIAASAKKSNLKLNLCGKFESVELENEIVNSYENISYLGFLDRDGISNILHNSTIGFVTLLPTPNHLNSYPIKMFEYMAAGIPVIASNFKLWSEIIEEIRCGLCVDPNNVDEISKAIKYIMDNPEEARTMGENGRKAVLDKYNWCTQEEILLQLYEIL